MVPRCETIYRKKNLAPAQFSNTHVRCGHNFLYFYPADILFSCCYLICENCLLTRCSMRLAYFPFSVCQRGAKTSWSKIIRGSLKSQLFKIIMIFEFAMPLHWSRKCFSQIFGAPLRSILFNLSYLLSNRLINRLVIGTINQSKSWLLNLVGEYLWQNVKYRRVIFLGEVKNVKIILWWKIHLVSFLLISYKIALVSARLFLVAQKCDIWPTQGLDLHVDLLKIIINKNVSAKYLIGSLSSLL